METASHSVEPNVERSELPERGLQHQVVVADHRPQADCAAVSWCSITVFFFLGGFFAMLIRLELLTPAGDLVLADTYNKLFTMHGIVMIFLFLIPSIPAVFGNFLIPDDDRRQGSGLPKVEPGELVHLHDRSSASFSMPS